MIPGAARQTAFLILACMAVGGCGDLFDLTEVQEETHVWTPEAIAQQPLEYLAYAEKKIAEQIVGREDKLEDLALRKKEIQGKAGDLAARLSDAKNVLTRLTSAVQKADDEDRWPLKFAGRTFDRQKAQSVLEGMRQFLSDYGPLGAAYDDALRKLASTENALHKDIADLSRMRDKVGIDMERVRLNQGMDAIADLRKTESDLAGFSQTLAEITSDTLVDLQDIQPPVAKDVNDLLK